MSKINLSLIKILKEMKIINFGNFTSWNQVKAYIGKNEKILDKDDTANGYFDMWEDAFFMWEDGDFGSIQDLNQIIQKYPQYFGEKSKQPEALLNLLILPFLGPTMDSETGELTGEYDISYFGSDTNNIIHKINNDTEN